MFRLSKPVFKFLYEHSADCGVNINLINCEKKKDELLQKTGDSFSC